MKFFKKEVLTSAPTLVGGAILGNLAYNKLTQVQNAKVKAAIILAAGIVASSQKNKMIAGIGNGLIVSGGVKLASSFIPGIGGIDADDVIEGVYDDTSALNGAMDSLNGPDAVLNGMYGEDESGMYGDEDQY